ncbi:hypothetical protein Nepgr_029282 [Nepenthes gracilis]|uniref:Uncharacterized protein n=1 Tax=Nepenthes gracilis TaxID=150966 RepID=A0AAD3TEC7_NEPGR|nr:hypothetical protein Nepgr_029282 [Nepenthes gracilis]
MSQWHYVVDAVLQDLKCFVFPLKSHSTSKSSQYKGHDAFNDNGLGKRYLRHAWKFLIAVVLLESWSEVIVIYVHLYQQRGFMRLLKVSFTAAFQELQLGRFHRRNGAEGVDELENPTSGEGWRRPLTSEGDADEKASTARERRGGYNCIARCADFGVCFANDDGEEPQRDHAVCSVVQGLRARERERDQLLDHQDLLVAAHSLLRLLC